MARRTLWLTAATTLLSACGCGAAPDDATAVNGTSDSSRSESGLRSISLQLNWIPDAQHGGFFAAQVGNHFAQAGLRAEILPGGPGTPVLPKVAMGRCDFAVANADQVLLARAQGADIVAVFAAMQNSPRCIMVHESSGIESLQQLSDVTLALGDGKAFAEYLKKNAPLRNVRIVSYSGSVAKFLIDPNFAQQGYVFSEPIVAKSQGGDPRALMVSKLGFNPYSSLLVTRRALLDENPELVQNVVNAVRAGWADYLRDAAPANAAIQAINPEMQAEILTAAAREIRTLVSPTGNDDLGRNLGRMDAERWQTLEHQLVELGLLPRRSDDLSRAFSN